jgi:hypothetical protein
MAGIRKQVYVLLNSICSFGPLRKDELGYLPHFPSTVMYDHPHISFETINSIHSENLWIYKTTTL